MIDFDEPRIAHWATLKEVLTSESCQDPIATGIVLDYEHKVPRLMTGRTAWRV